MTIFTYMYEYVLEFRVLIVICLFVYYINNDSSILSFKTKV